MQLDETRLGHYVKALSLHTDTRYNICTKAASIFYDLGAQHHHITGINTLLFSIIVWVLLSLPSEQRETGLTV